MIQFNPRIMNENAPSFLGGFLMGGSSSFYIWKDHFLLQISTNDLLIEYAVKIAGTLILGLVGGLAGMLAKDIYRILKKKLFKQR